MKVVSALAKGVTKLDLITEADVIKYKMWCARSVDILTEGRQGMWDILKWAERATDRITEETEYQYASSTMDIQSVTRVLYMAIKVLISDATVSRFADTAGQGRGLELWRILYRECVNKSAPVVAKMIGGIMNPVRCTTMHQLRLALPRWLEEQEIVKQFDKDSHLGPMVLTNALLLLIPLEFEK